MVEACEKSLPKAGDLVRPVGSNGNGILGIILSEPYHDIKKAEASIIGDGIVDVVWVYGADHYRIDWNYCVNIEIVCRDFSEQASKNLAGGIEWHTNSSSK